MAKSRGKKGSNKMIPNKKKNKQNGVKKKMTKHDKNNKKNSGNQTRSNSRGAYKYSAKKLQGLSLRDRMLEKLNASRFRYMNEQLYNMRGKDALQYFAKNREDFTSYHAGYKSQVQNWPINPLNVIIDSLKISCKSGSVVADFGCGEAQLAKSLPNLTVHSFDLVSLDPCVTVCDMARTPLGDSSVDVTVFCLSLMGTNFTDYLKEANRVLKENGMLKIAEVESRFENVDDFTLSLSKYGFSSVATNYSYDLFYFMDFKKTRNIGKNSKKKLPSLTLKPCLYKKR